MAESVGDILRRHRSRQHKWAIAIFLAGALSGSFLTHYTVLVQLQEAVSDFRALKQQ